MKSANDKSERCLDIISSRPFITGSQADGLAALLIRTTQNLYLTFTSTFASF